MNVTTSSLIQNHNHLAMDVLSFFRFCFVFSEYVIKERREEKREEGGSHVCVKRFKLRVNPPLVDIHILVDVVMFICLLNILKL